LDSDEPEDAGCYCSIEHGDNRGHYSSPVGGSIFCSLCWVSL
jgi:hypothetical protein